MPRTNPTIERLRRIPLFTACTDDELALIASRTTEVHAKAGDILAREGHTGREFVVIAEGTARVMIADRQVATLEVGDFFGEVALLDNGPRTASVIAETDLVADVSSQQEFAELIERAPTLARTLLVGVAQRLRAADLLLGL
jgi:CRP/FNR family transcriptional regulator, cyclic AMP receptor protein